MNYHGICSGNAAHKNLLFDGGSKVMSELMVVCSMDFCMVLCKAQMLILSDTVCCELQLGRASYLTLVG